MCVHKLQMGHKKYQVGLKPTIKQCQNSLLQPLICLFTFLNDKVNLHYKNNAIRQGKVTKGKDFWH